MRIRIYSTFASNNSGSYTLVGSFRDPASAAEAASTLAAMCAAHSSWYEKRTDEPFTDSPLHAFAREQALHGVPDEPWDHWPEHGPPPSIVHLGYQVLVLVPYTVTMPRVLGAFIYKRGGRVSLELDHSHEELACELTFRVPGARFDDQSAADRIEGLRGPIDAALPELTARSPNDGRSPVAPVWHRGDFGDRHLSVVFADAAAGILRIREITSAAGIQTHVRLYEVRDPDPFVTLRGTGRLARGHYRVALWKTGDDRVEVLKIVRDLADCGLSEARALVEDLPVEILVDVSREVAEAAVASLLQTGSTAEAYLVSPRPNEQAQGRADADR